MSCPPEILTIYYKHKPGGFCKRLRKAMDAFIDRGWRVHYIAVEPFPYSHPNLIPHILPCPFRDHGSFLFWIYFFTSIPFYAVWIVLKNHVNFITAFSPVYAFFSLSAKWVCGAKMLTFLWSRPGFHTDCRKKLSPFRPIEFWLEKIGLIFSNAIISNSHSCRNAWMDVFGVSLKRTRVLPNDVSPPHFDKREQRERLLDEFQLSSDCFILSTASILEPHKNLETLLKGFSQIKHKDSALLILGDGVQLESLRKLSQILKIESRVIFTGWRKDAPALIQGTDLFIFPSLREGMSESLLEAAACGVPCLVSDIPENTEVITNPDQWFSPSDPDILAEKINRMISDPTIYEKALESTLNEKERFVFDWGIKLAKEVEKIMESRK